jgi:hypothetical protein
MFHLAILASGHFSFEQELQEGYSVFSHAVGQDIINESLGKIFS